MTTENNKAVQIGNTADNISGRDTIINNSIHNYGVDKFPRLKELYALYEKEKESNIQFKQFTEELERFRTPKVEKVLGLIPKLTAGDRAHFIEYAEDVMDIYTQKLYKNALFKSAQDVNVYFLGLVWEYYTNSVYPLICDNASQQEIGNAITEFITTPLQGALEGNTLGFTSSDISGMLYFLTANCHIKWTKPDIN